MSSTKVILALDILQDIKRHFFSYLLALSVVISAFLVIYFTHMNRQTTSELEVLLTQRDELDIEWRNLLLEEQSQSEHSRVTRMATKELNMARPLPKEEVIIRVQ